MPTQTPKSLNLRVRGLQQSATLAINERVAEIREQGRKVYNLGLGQSPFPVPGCITEALRQHAHEKDYLPVKGLYPLREAVASFHRIKDQVDARADDVLIGPGSKELLFLLQLVYYGEIWVPSPCWVSYVPQATIIGRTVRFVQTDFEDRWRITPERFQRILESQHDDERPRLFVLNYPGNPDGCSYSSMELQELAAIARRYKIVILSDEIYGQLHHKGKHISIAHYYPEGTIISSGLSKWCGAGGWRLGTFTFPKQLHWLLEAMSAVASETYTSVSAPIQYAAIEAFQENIAIDRYLCHSRRILEQLGNQAAAVLSGAGIRVHPPEGAFYLFADFSPFKAQLAERGIHSSADLCSTLLADTGVAMLPGEPFGRPCDELTARLAYVDFDGAAAIKASEMVSLDAHLPRTFSRTCCPHVMQGMDRIAEWIGSPGKTVAAEHPEAEVTVVK